jgi:teichuronic acid exporter
MTDSRTPLGGLAASGMLWVSVGTFASKLASLGAQLVLGWVLSTEDFALYAIAISWSTIILALRNAGTQRFLIQKGKDYDEFASICFKIAILFNGIGFVLLALAAPALSHLYDSHALKVVIWIIAISLPLNTASLIFQAKLSSELKFGKLTRITIWSALLRHGSMAAFALMGLGPISFVLPLVVIAVYETAAGWYAVGAWPPERRLTWQAMRGVLQASRWVMLTSLAGILVINGDYLAISLLQTKETLGIYYFGFQLSFSLAALFTNGVEAVMMPAFSRLQHDLERQRVGFFKAVRVLMLGSTFACFALILTARPLVHGLWGGKWDSAIPVIQVLALSLPIKLVIPLCRSLVEGRGEWKFMSTLLLVDGIGTVIAGGLGAWFGGLMSIAAVVSGYNFVFGLMFCGFVTKRIGGQLSDMFIPMLSTFAFGLLALVLTVGLSYLVSIDNTDFLKAFGLVALYSMIFACLIRFFLQASVGEIVSLIRQQVSGLGLVKRET